MADRGSRLHRNPLTLDGLKTDIWSVVCIGEGSFRHTVSGRLTLPRLAYCTVVGDDVSTRREHDRSDAAAVPQLDGPDFMSFSGEIRINDDVRLSGFRAGGLFIKVSSRVAPAVRDFSLTRPCFVFHRDVLASQDCIVLSVHPPDPAKCPFTELRTVVPVRLTTDGWGTEGNVLLAGSEYSIPSTPSPEEGQVGQQHFRDYRERTP